VYVVHAQLIDTPLSNFNVDREGTLKRRDRAKETLAVAALTTGGGAVAGAMLGGGVGALVGAGVGAGSNDGDVAEAGTAGYAGEGFASGLQPDDAADPQAGAFGICECDGAVGPALKAATAE
jgi:uncharacterized protein YcfJ